MGEPVFLAVDAGTTRLKAALLDARGRQRDQAGASLPPSYPFDGASEMDMEAVWDALCGLTRMLAERNPGSWPDLAGMAIAGQGDGLWPVDRGGRPVRPAILWNDTRAKRLDLPDLPELQRYCAGHGVTPLFSGAMPLLLLWLRRQEPEQYARIHRALHCKDWLNYRLTGELATDFSDASTAVLDVAEGRYDPGLLERLDLPGALGLLPEPRPSSAPLGRVTAAAAARTGLPPGLQVMAGALDVAAVAEGAGAVHSGSAVTIVGTTLCNEVVVGPGQAPNADGLGSTLCHVRPELYLRLMATSSGTSSLDWARALAAPGLSFAQVEAELARIPPGCDGALFHPYLHGERAPFRNALACAGFYGLTALHTPMHLLRAAYEGLALSFHDCLRHLPQVGELAVTGGGAASDLLCQMFADCLERPVRRPGFPELGLAGAARLVWAGLGFAGEMPLEEPMPARVFAPDAGRHAVYERMYALSVDLRAGLEPYWRAREDMLSGASGPPAGHRKGWG
jgi:sugar (pentulose or hexulose) kinase